MRFTVSPGDIVTSFILSYDVSAECSGTLTYTGLALPIRHLDPPGPPPFDQPGFGFGRDEAAGGTAFAGHFSPDRRMAAGVFALANYGACPSGQWTWDATRR